MPGVFITVRVSIPEVRDVCVKAFYGEQRVREARCPW